MKKSLTIKAFAFALLAIVATACSKYEEGSKFTVLTKKSRVVNTWKLDRATLTIDATGTEQDVTPANTTIIVETQKDGTAITTTTVGSLSSTDNGTWAFNDDKSSLIVTDSSGDAMTYEIVKLKANEMKLRASENGTTTVIEYVTN